MVLCLFVKSIWYASKNVYFLTFLLTVHKDGGGVVQRLYYWAEPAPPLHSRWVNLLIVWSMRT